jgi:osmotically-inducible protein OsmY
MSRRYGGRDYYRDEDFGEREERYGRGYETGRGRYGSSGFGGYGGGDEARRRFTSGGYEEDYDTGRFYGSGSRSYEGDYGSRGYGGYGGSAEEYGRGEAGGAGGYGRERSRGLSSSRDYGSSSRDYGSRSGGYGSGGAGAYGRGFDREGEYGGGSEYGRSPRAYTGRVYDYERGTDYDQGFRGGYASGRDYGSGRYDYGSGGYSSRGSDRGESRERYGRDDRYSERRGRDEDDRGWFDRAADEVRSWFGDEEAERRRRMDESRGGEGGDYFGGRNRGRGPKNYRRSDERIREDVSDRLSDHDWLDASEIEVEARDGEVTLTGTVESRYAKRLAEDIAESCSGVTHVQNNLRVRSRESRGYGAGATAAGATQGGMTGAASSGPAGGVTGGTPTGTSGASSTAGATPASGVTDAGSTQTTTTGGAGRAARTSS